MAINLSMLKNKSNTDLSQKYGKLMTGNRNEDLSFWRLTRDSKGSGSAVLRFLPNPEGKSDLNIVQYYDHFFKGPTGNYYVANSLTTFKEYDMISSYCRYLWKENETTGNESLKKEAREYGRKNHFVANILVVSDTENPENNGKVFKFIFGKKIFDKIKAQIQPEFQDQTPCDVFDIIHGKNFNLRCRMVDGYPNYDMSDFSQEIPIFPVDDEFDNKVINVLEQYHSLDYIANQNGIYNGKPFYQTMEELNELFYKAFGFYFDLQKGKYTKSDAVNEKEEIIIRESKTSTPLPKKDLSSQIEEEDNSESLKNTSIDFDDDIPF